MNDERVFLTPERAEAMLPDGQSVHTFRQPVAGVLIGADWPRSRVIEEFSKHTPELSGPAATAMKHGICLHDGISWLFFATKPEEGAAA